jgi:phosphoribosyl-ATP pyrophosphohydrolase
MAYFPDKLYEIIKDRAGDNTRVDSKTKYLLEKGGPTIIRKFIEEAGDVTGAAIEQDLDQLMEEIADVWYYTLVICLYYGITPEQVERCLITRHKAKQ